MSKTGVNTTNQYTRKRRLDTGMCFICDIEPGAIDLFGGKVCQRDYDHVKKALKAHHMRGYHERKRHNG